MIIQGWTIDRGRADEMGKNAPGTATVNMMDTTGELDPTNPAYSFAPMTPSAIALRNPVTATDHTVFRGHVARFKYKVHPTERFGMATMELIDGMDMLANTEMTTGLFGNPVISVAYPGQVVFAADATGNACSTRINKVLDQTGFPSGLREVFSGNVKLKFTVYAPRSSALSAIQDTADAEFPGIANFYFQKDGKATFHGRLARFNPADAQYHISTRKAGDIAAVNADSTRALIFDLDYDKDKDNIINSALATTQGIADSDYEAQLVTNAASITAHGRRSISFENLVTDGDHFGAAVNAAVKKFATYYVNNFKDPRVRVRTITFRSLGASHPNAARVWQILCNVDISDIINLSTTHIGGAGGFNEDFYVEGLHYTAGPMNAEHHDVTLTLDVSPKAYYNSNPF